MPTLIGAAVCMGPGISLPSLVGPETAPGSWGWKPTVLHAVSTAGKWRESHRCFDLHGREIRRVSLTGSSKEIGQGGVGFGCGAICCQCLPWRKAPRPGQAAWGGRSNHPWAGELCGSQRARFRGTVSLVISRHSLVLEQILRTSPSTTASVIFLGFKKEKTNQEALRCVRR